MRRFVLVALLSLCSVAAFASSRFERPSVNNTYEYEVSQIIVGNMGMENIPYQSVVFSNDDTFNFVSEDGTTMTISYNWDSHIATINSNGETKQVKAKVTRGKDGKMLLAYGGYEIYLQKVK